MPPGGKYVKCRRWKISQKYDFILIPKTMNCIQRFLNKRLPEPGIEPAKCGKITCNFTILNQSEQSN